MRIRQTRFDVHVHVFQLNRHETSGLMFCLSRFRFRMVGRAFVVERTCNIVDGQWSRWMFVMIKALIKPTEASNALDKGSVGLGEASPRFFPS